MWLFALNCPHVSMLSYATCVTEQRPADETAAQALKYYLSYERELGR